MKRLLQYMRTMQDRKLGAWADTEDEPALMEHYVDSDHAGDRKGVVKEDHNQEQVSCLQ